MPLQEIRESQQVWSMGPSHSRNKEDPLSITTSLLLRVKIEPFLDTIITSDEE